MAEQELFDINNSIREKLIRILNNIRQSYEDLSPSETDDESVCEKMKNIARSMEELVTFLRFITDNYIFFDKNVYEHIRSGYFSLSQEDRNMFAKLNLQAQENVKRKMN